MKRILEHTDLYINLLDQLEKTWTPLPDKPEETPEITLRALWHCAGGKPISLAEALEAPLPEIDDEGRQQLEALVSQRIGGTPLPYLTGRQQFMGLGLLSGSGAMIPRRETEILGSTAIDTAHELAAERGSIQVVDLCTGSGNLALAIAYYEKRTSITGIDISDEAVELAKQNARYLGMSERVHFLRGDLFSPVDQADYWGHFDMVVCNPPYISSAQVDRMPEAIQQYEPRLAFDGGPFGVRILQRLINEAPRFLKPASYLCFEVGLGQGPVLEKMLRKNGAYEQIAYFSDHQGEIRVLKARTAA